MYGSRVVEQKGFDVYISDDLENWIKKESIFEIFDGFWATGECWAPEVYYYDGKFYIFSSFKSSEHSRASQILISDTPDGKFKVHSSRITPEDGTIHGKWVHKDEMVFKKDGGHAMIFETFDGKRMISLHAPNSPFNERPHFLPFDF